MHSDYKTIPFKQTHKKLYGMMALCFCITTVFMVSNYVSVYALTTLFTAPWAETAHIIFLAGWAALVSLVGEIKMKGLLEKNVDKGDLFILRLNAFTVPLIWYAVLVYYVKFGLIWAILIGTAHLAYQSVLIVMQLRKIKGKLLVAELVAMDMYKLMYEEYDI